MLVLRKEIKIGVAAGLAIIGIAGVYGLLASVSSNGNTADSKTTAEVAPDDQTAARQKAIASAVDGLPQENTTTTTPPVSVATTDTPKDPANDPFAESRRTDGNTKADVWSSALSTGRVADVTQTNTKASSDKLSTDLPAIIKAPTPNKTDRSDTFAANTDATNTTDKKTLKADTHSEPGTSTASNGKYKVQAGDTFSTIAAKVYGSKKYGTALVKANPEVNPSRMKIGQEIAVPPKEQVASVGGSVAPEAAKLAAPIDATRQYRVAAGDTLSRISQKLYGKSTMWQDIYEANKAAIGPNEAKLKLGTVLNLPQKPVR